MIRLLLALLFFAACAAPISRQGKEKAEQEILTADTAMSGLATRIGFFPALLQYSDDSVIIAREGKLPIIGKGMAAFSWKDNVPIKILTWHPVRVEAADDGSLGYSFGFWRLQQPDTTTYGDYCTVWKRSPSGWKFVYDGGHNTPAPPKEK